MNVLPIELKVDAKLDDVTRVSIDRLFQEASGRNLASIGLDPQSFQLVDRANPRGKVAEIEAGRMR